MNKNSDTNERLNHDFDSNIKMEFPKDQFQDSLVYLIYQLSEKLHKSEKDNLFFSDKPVFSSQVRTLKTSKPNETDTQLID